MSIVDVECRERICAHAFDLGNIVLVCGDGARCRGAWCRSAYGIFCEAIVGEEWLGHGCIYNERFGGSILTSQ